MQTANNNFTVEALVAKYRNFVDEHCPKSCESDGVHEFAVPDKDESEEQLLVTLYKKVAGKNADQNILEALSKYADDFYVEALNEEELTFLANHFSEVSAFIFSYFVTEYYGRVYWLQRPSQKVYDFIATIKIEAGMTVFIGSLGLCDIAMLFPNCTIKGYCEDSFADKEMWALGQIRLFAAGIKSKVLPCYKDTANSQYMADVDVAIVGAADLPYSNSKTEVLFSYMKPNSNFLLFVGKRNLAEDSFLNLRKMLIDGKYIDSIVSFEEADDVLDNISQKNIILYANKALKSSVYIKNDVTGEEMLLASDMLDSKILWPSYYLTARPQNGISLSEIASFQDLSIKKNSDVSFKSEYNYEEDRREWVLSDKEKMIKVVIPTNLATEYKNANISDCKLSVAGDYTFTGALGKVHNIEWPCVLLYGRKGKYTVGYVKNLPPEGIIAFHLLVCLVPKKGIDVRYVAALLLTPEVRNQIMSICEGEVDAQLFPLIMDKIIVPNHSDLERATFLSEANYQAIEASKKKMEESLNEKKAEYINEVRMRKHDMRPHLRQMASSERLMLYYLDNTNDVEDLKKLLKKQISTSHNALQSLSELVEHLSDEERFGEPECVNLSEYFHNIEKNSNVNFMIKVSCEKALAQRKKEMEELKEKNKKENVTSPQDIHEKPITECSLNVYIAPVDLDRMVNNIIENARRHGGLSDGIKSDFYISIDVKIDYQRDMYQIDFSNNGKPLPKGMTKERYGLKGEKAGPNAGTGSGGYIVKSIVEHYGGDFDLFTNNGITTIRIYLPKYL